MNVMQTTKKRMINAANTRYFVLLLGATGRIDMLASPGQGVFLTNADIIITKQTSALPDPEPLRAWR